MGSQLNPYEVNYLRKRVNSFSKMSQLSLRTESTDFVLKYEMLKSRTKK